MRVADQISIVGNQFDVCVLDFGDQPIDGEHELLSALVRAVDQQPPGVCCERIIASSVRPSLYFAETQMCETTDVIGTPSMPKCAE
jgi:hypothetical protein